MVIMANPAQECQCLPYENLCCCGTLNGITVTQPLCQTLPDGSVVNNPAFSSSFNKSFWTYKFLTDCAQLTRGISGIGIPICSQINAANITVEEKVDGCGAFTAIPFELIANDPNFGPAPMGTVFLKIETSGRFDKGVCVMYRISIVGNYPVISQPITVKAANVIYTFGCGLCFYVPGCQQEGKLLVSKDSVFEIINNQAVYEGTVTVDNVGTGTLNPVMFEDIILIPLQLTIGPVIVSPDGLTVDTSVPGQVKISGSLGSIEPGGRVTVSYSIVITGILRPGVYTINNTARAVATGTESSDSSTATLDVVRLRADKCCSVDAVSGTFTLSIATVGDSPTVTVDITDRMVIPVGVTIFFTSFGGCELYYAGTTEPIPPFTYLTGPVNIDILCKNQVVPAEGSINKSIEYTLVSSTVVGTAAIVNTFTNVSPVNLSGIVYEGTDNLPAQASIAVELSQSCNDPCL